MADFDLVTTVIPNAIARLGCNSAAELSPLWVIDELYEYADDSIKRFARDYGLFAQVADPIVTAPPQASYSMPTDSLAMLQASWSGILLRPMTVREAEALDSNWQTATAATPSRWVADAGVQTILLYPAPTGGGTLDLVYLGCPPDVSATQTTVAGLCAGLGDLIELTIVAEARRRESDAQMPEVAQVLDAVAGLYKMATAEYWGSGE